ncbi:ABC transporter substrate-binding protein [Arthrobacter tecti]
MTPPSLSRRSLLSAGLTIGAGSLAAGLTGCGPSQPVSEIPLRGATGVPAPGKRLRVARPAASAAETLDSASSLSAYEYLGALYNRLVKLDREGQTVADLAEEWSSTPDGRVWTFRLRPNVKFHNGQTLVAADAAYSITRILDPEVASPQAGVLAPILEPAGIRATDPLTLVFELLSPNAEFPSLLTAYQCYIVPEGIAPTPGFAVGTGPFQLSSFTPAGRGSVEAFPDHFAGPPALEGIDFYSVQDTSARVNALLAGQIDFISQTNLDFATARVVASSSNTTVARSENAQWYTIPMLATSPEFSDPLVRQAMKLAYDPQDIVATALQGNGTPGWDNPVTPSDAAFLDFQREYDPEKARALLQQAGQEGFTAEIFTSAYDPVFTPMAVAYADAVKAAGIDLRVTSASADSYYTEIWIQEPLCVSYWFTGRPIDQLLNQIFRSGSSYNEAAWSNEQFDELLVAARREMNDERRRSIYQDAQRVIIDDGADMTPMFGDRLVGLARNVVNYDEYGFEFDYINIGLT